VRSRGPHHCHRRSLEALAATLALGSVGYEHERAANGDYHVWLDARTMNNLDALRQPGENYSVAIIRLVAMERGGRRRPPWL
jgi:hypothetical protein